MSMGFIDDALREARRAAKTAGKAGDVGWILARAKEGADLDLGFMREREAACAHGRRREAGRRAADTRKERAIAPHRKAAEEARARARRNYP